YAGAGLVLAVGLLGSALAPNMPVLVGWRFVQGLGGGAVAALSYGLVAATFPVELRGRVLSTISTIWGVATVGGPGYGALFAGPGLWRAAFWSLAPLALIFVALAWRTIGGEPAAGPRARMPYWRLILLALSVLLLSMTSVAGSHWLQALLVAAAIASATAAFIRDAKAERPIFPRRVTAIGTELGALFWIFFCVSIMISFVNTYTTFFLQVLHGVAPLTAGYLFAIQSFMWTAGALMVASRPASQTVSLVTIGLGMMLVAAIGLFITVVSGPVAAIAAAIALAGTGIGFLNNPAIQKIIVVAREEEKQLAANSVQTVRNIGMSFGAAGAGTVAASAGLQDGAAPAVVAHAMQWVYGVNVVVAIVALAIALAVLRGRSGEEIG
ncbi:MAG: MFS transporter, partial [Beijerinckiaceae bacterium]